MPHPFALALLSSRGGPSATAAASPVVSTTTSAWKAATGMSEPAT